MTGEPTPILEGVRVLNVTNASFALADDGSLVYVPGEALVRRTLVWVDRDGTEEELGVEPRAYSYPRISPDGSLLALDIRDQEEDIWIWDFARASLRRLTFDRATDMIPEWTPDGRFVVFGSGRDRGFVNLFSKAADGTGPVERLTESEITQFPNAFSPDGKQLVFEEVHPRTGSNLFVRSLDGNGAVVPLLESEYQETNSSLSPGGRWLAYESNESGRYEIYVRPFPNVDEGKWQISKGGGMKPLWARDGRELFYLSPSGQLTVVPVRAEESFAFGSPEIVLERTYFIGRAGRTYDVSPDGKRFLMIKEGTGDENSRKEIIIVQNWFSELERLVPTR